MSTERVLAFVNRRHRRDYRLVGKLPGGFQSGAYRIRDASGGAVLKWTTKKSWAGRVVGAAPVVAAARSAGLAWSAKGSSRRCFLSSSCRPAWRRIPTQR
ncbi:hypothetical protein [Fodinicola acaciae]|uniref:hypothetical protein n=1 Tax=Fodinicola acaciae TaxID=2681555 RepID=UPI0013D2851D|nr:hypothetical protein [Fodinicola acaciae]